MKELIYTADVSYPFSLTNPLNELLNKNIIKENQLFLDLGSGHCKPLLDAAKAGLIPYGIEINKETFNESIKRLTYLKDHNKIPEDIFLKIALGSYYPKEYIELREKGKSISKNYEKGIFIDIYNNKREFSESEINAWFHPICTISDPYELLKIKIQDVDIFFSYTWGPELASQLELFKLFARDDSIFINDCYTRHESILDILKELDLKSTIIDQSDRKSLMMFEKMQ